MTTVTNNGVPDFSTAKGFGGYEEDDTAHLLQMAHLDPMQGDGEEGMDGLDAFNALESMGYEEEGGADLNTFDASAFDAEAALLFGDSGAPMGDPFSEMPDADLTKMSLGCDYPEAGPTPPPAMLEADSSPKADSVCGGSEATGTADNSCDLTIGEESLHATPEGDPEESTSLPPPTPEVDYDDIAVDSEELARQREAEAAAAAAALREMGLEIDMGGAKGKRGTKSRKSRMSTASRLTSEGDDAEDLNVKAVRSKRRGTNASRLTSGASDEADVGTVDAIPTGSDAFVDGGVEQPIALPTDSAPSRINDSEVTHGQLAVEADTRSPNDVLLTYRARLSEVEEAVGWSPKLAYTAVATSEGYLAVGCATGGTFVFSRGDHRFQCALPGGANDRGVSRLAFAPDDHLLAVAAESGVISLWRGPWGTDAAHPSHQPVRLKQVVEHDGSTVTSMSWSSNAKNLFVGDSSGLVTRTPVVKQPIVPSASKMFPRLRVLQKVVSNVVPQTDVVHRCGCAVVQVMAGSAGVVLISSLKQTIIADPSKRALWVVGKKLRYGEYGACFGPGRHFPAVFSARPGSRIWIAKSRTGHVTATISVKAHFDSSSTPLLRTDGAPSPAVSPSEGPLATNFAQLVPVREKYLLSWSRDRIVVIDPGKARLVGWYTEITGIVDVSVINEEIYCLCEAPADDVEGGNDDDGASTGQMKFRVIQLALLSPGETAAEMAVAGNTADAARMVLEYYQNATPEKFLENVQEADLTLVQQRLAEDPNGAAPELVQHIADLAACATELRVKEENQLAADAESALMQRLDSRSDTESSIVIDASNEAAEGATSDDGNDYASSLPGMSPAPSVEPHRRPSSTRLSSTRLSTDPPEPMSAGGGGVAEYGELDNPIIT